MKRNLKTTMTIILLSLVLAALPLISRAADESKAAEPKAADAKAAEQKQEDKVTGEIAAAFLSAYIWRGQEMTRHSAVIQPSITASYKGFTANIWGNLDTRPYGAAEEKNSAN